MNDERLDRLADEIRSWTRRPPARTPQVARTRVLAGIARPRFRAAWKLAAAAAAVAVALTAGFLLDPGPPPPEPDAPAAPAQKLLVYELESGTKLYLALNANP